MRWEADGHESLLFPGPEVTVQHFSRPDQPEALLDEVVADRSIDATDGAGYR